MNYMKDYNRLKSIRSSKCSFDIEANVLSQKHSHIEVSEGPIKKSIFLMSFLDFSPIYM